MNKPGFCFVQRSLTSMFNKSFSKLINLKGVTLKFDCEGNHLPVHFVFYTESDAPSLVSRFPYPAVIYPDGFRNA